MKAKLIKTALLKGNANLYELDINIKYNNGKKTAYIIVSRAATFDRGDETMIFPATKEGKVIDFGDLYVGYGEDHNTALHNYGVEIKTVVLILKK